MAGGCTRGSQANGRHPGTGSLKNFLRPQDARSPCKGGLPVCRQRNAKATQATPPQLAMIFPPNLLLAREDGEPLCTPVGGGLARTEPALPRTSGHSCLPSSSLRAPQWRCCFHSRCPLISSSPSSHPLNRQGRRTPHGNSLGAQRPNPSPPLQAPVKLPKRGAHSLLERDGFPKV